MDTTATLTDDDSRDRAALEIVAGYMAAIDALDPDDTRARSWYGARLADARIIAGLPPLQSAR